MSLPIERYTLGLGEHVALSMVPCQAKPHPLPIRADGIPEAMRIERRWVVWKYEWIEGKDGKPGKWTKPLYIATAPQTHAKSTDPTTWRTFAEALAQAQAQCDGIGFVLGDGWVGFDSDRTDSPEYVQLLNSYTERSPSGTGVHSIMRGSKPPGRCRVGPYELYDNGRYFTVTGQHVPHTPTTVEERTTEIATLHGLLFPTKTEASASQANAQSTTSDDDLIALAKAAKNGEKFTALWSGDTSGYPSQSEADTAFCAMLAFWTNRNAIQIDRLFRRSGLMRPKWDERRGNSTWGANLVEWVIGQTSEVYTPSQTHVIVDGEPPPNPARTVAYTFEPAFPSGHFVANWIETFSKQCDAALEYHEAAALVALAQMTPSLMAFISGSSTALRTNLYVLFIGPAGKSRKSTAKDYAVGALASVAPKVLLPEQMTQESFVESLTFCNGGAALWAIDEFTDTLCKMLTATYQVGMRGLLLELYSHTNYTYRRVSKGTRKQKDGEDGERQEDAFYISNVSLSVIGCATPTLFQNLDSTAVGSGLLTRFAIVMPEGKPPRLPQYELPEGDITPSALLDWLQNIRTRTADQFVKFDTGVLQRLDEAIDKPLDESADRYMMTVRAGVMARKISMLSAAGRPIDFQMSNQPLVVTMEDAESAIRVVNRWIAYGQAFETRMDESSFEVNVQRCVEIVKGRSVTRRDIARRVHLPAKMITEIEQTLAQRGEIEIIEYKPKTGRPSHVWKWIG